MNLNLSSPHGFGRAVLNCRDIVGYIQTGWNRVWQTGLNAAFTRRVPAKTRFQQDARAEGRARPERRQSVRGAKTLGDPTPLRLPAGDGRRARQLGDSQGADAQSRRATA